MMTVACDHAEDEHRATARLTAATWVLCAVTMVLVAATVLLAAATLKEKEAHEPVPTQEVAATQ
jgi:hypothetical protein